MQHMVQMIYKEKTQPRRSRQGPLPRWARREAGAHLGGFEALGADVCFVCALAAVQLGVGALVGAVEVAAAVGEERLVVQVVLVVRRQAAVHATFLRRRQQHTSDKCALSAQKMTSM